MSHLSMERLQLRYTQVSLRDPLASFWSCRALFAQVVIAEVKIRLASGLPLVKRTALRH